MQVENNKLNDDVIGVIHEYLSDIDRFNDLRIKYSNEFLTAGLKQKTNSQLELIHSKIIEMIFKDDCSSFWMLFNTVGIPKKIIGGAGYHLYTDLWKSWNSNINYDKKIQKIIDLFQRLCDIVNLKKIEYLTSIYLNVIKIRETSLLPEKQSVYVEKTTKILLLLVSILKNPSIKNSRKRKFENKKTIQEKYNLQPDVSNKLNLESIRQLRSIISMDSSISLGPKIRLLYNGDIDHILPDSY